MPRMPERYRHLEGRFNTLVSLGFFFPWIPNPTLCSGSGRILGLARRLWVMTASFGNFLNPMTWEECCRYSSIHENPLIQWLCGFIPIEIAAYIWGVRLLILLVLLQISFGLVVVTNRDWDLIAVRSDRITADELTKEWAVAVNIFSLAGCRDRTTLFFSDN